MPGRAGDWPESIFGRSEVPSVIAAIPAAITMRLRIVVLSALAAQGGQILDQMHQIRLRHRALESVRHERRLHALPLDDAVLRHAALDPADQLQDHLVLRLARDHPDELLAILRADVVALVA